MSRGDVDTAHRCVLGRDCLNSVVEAGLRCGVPIEASRGLCRACERRAARHVRELPTQWLRLRSTLGESRAVLAGGRRPKPGSSTPINLATDALMRDVVRVMHAAADLVGRQCNVAVPALRPNPSSVSEYRCLTAAAELVGPNVSKLVLLDEGPAAVEAITQQHRRTVKQLGENRQMERLHLPCPRCSVQSLVREVVDRRGWSTGVESTPEVVRCLTCHEEWSEAEYAWLSRIVIEERDEQAVLKWLLAELNWKYNSAQAKLEELERLAGLSAGDLEGIDAPAVVAMVREILEVEVAR